MIDWFVFSNQLTNLLTPWSRVPPGKLTGPSLLKKFPAFCGTRRFITAFTRASHLSLPSPRPVHNHLSSFLQVSPSTVCMHVYFFLGVPRAPLMSFYLILSPCNIWRIQTMKLHMMQFYTGSCYFVSTNCSG